MRDTKNIKIINKGFSPVAIKTPNREYLVEAASDDRPASIVLSYEDVDYINSNTNVFRSGLLTFEDADYDEVHEMLGNINIAETALSQLDIRDIILHPTYDKMQRLLNINDISTMERFRSELIRIKTLGVDGVSGNVEGILTERYKEVNSGFRATKITLKHERFANESDAQKVIEDMSAEMAAMKEALNKLTNASGSEVTAEEPVPTPAPVAPKPKAPRKSPSRPTKAKS